MSGLMDGLGGGGGGDPRYQKGANYFPPLTPEQEAQLRRQAIQSGMSPMDFMIGGALPGAAAGYAAQRFGRYLAGVPKHEVPLWMRSLMGGGSAAAGAGMGAMQGRTDYENLQNTIRDAEGQPGGFYGRR